MTSYDIRIDSKKIYIAKGSEAACNAARLKHMNLWNFRLCGSYELAWHQTGVGEEWRNPSVNSTIQDNGVNSDS